MRRKNANANSNDWSYPVLAPYTAVVTVACISRADVIGITAASAAGTGSVTGTGTGTAVYDAGTATVAIACESTTMV